MRYSFWLFLATAVAVPAVVASCAAAPPRPTGSDPPPPTGVKTVSVPEGTAHPIGMADGGN